MAVEVFISRQHNAVVLSYCWRPYEKKAKSALKIRVTTHSNKCHRAHSEKIISIKTNTDVFRLEIIFYCKRTS